MSVSPEAVLEGLLLCFCGRNYMKRQLQVLQYAVQEYVNIYMHNSYMYMYVHHTLSKQGLTHKRSVCCNRNNTSSHTEV